MPLVTRLARSHHGRPRAGDEIDAVALRRGGARRRRASPTAQRRRRLHQDVKDTMLFNELVPAGREQASEVLAEHRPAKRAVLAGPL